MLPGQMVVHNDIVDAYAISCVLTSAELVLSTKPIHGKPLRPTTPTALR